MGIPTYGRSFTLMDAADNGVDSAISGLGVAGSFAPQTNARLKNVIPYAEICYNLNQEGTSWESIWSQTHFTPYATYGENQWVGYDDETSVLAKIHLVLDNDFAGINYAALDYDDFCMKKMEKFWMKIYFLFFYFQLDCAVRLSFH